MEPHKLTETERQEVYDTMLRRIAKDHPAWRPKHKRRLAEYLTNRFSDDYAAGKIIAVEETIPDDQ